MAIARLTLCPPAPEGRAGGRWALYQADADGAWREEAWDRGCEAQGGRLCDLHAPALMAQDGPVAHYVRHMLAARAPRLRRGAPIVLMTHGFQYEPRAPATLRTGQCANPHAHLFGFEDIPPEEIPFCRRMSPWPARLGFAPEDAGESGLALGFGWSSDPAYGYGDWRDWFARLRWNGAGFTSSYAIAYRDALRAALGMAAVIKAIAHAAPGREIDLFAHSLGARVMLGALRILAEREERAALKSVGRAVLICAASHCIHARAALKAVQAAGAQPQIFNVIVERDSVLGYFGRRFGELTDESEVNDHSLTERAMRLFSGGSVIGLDGRPPMISYPHWIDIPLDRPRVIDWAANLPRPLDFTPDTGFDHWAGYRWAPYMEFYKAILRDRKEWSVNTLRWGLGERPPLPHKREAKDWPFLWMWPRLSG